VVEVEVLAVVELTAPVVGGTVDGWVVPLDA